MNREDKKGRKILRLTIREEQEGKTDTQSISLYVL